MTIDYRVSETMAEVTFTEEAAEAATLLTSTAQTEAASTQPKLTFVTVLTVDTYAVAIRTQELSTTLIIWAKIRVLTKDSVVSVVFANCKRSRWSPSYTLSFLQV
jgi:hypothetical protein